MEPVSPDKYWIVSGKVEINGKKGTGRIKKWYDVDEKCFKEKVLDFSAFSDVYNSDIEDKNTALEQENQE